MFNFACMSLGKNIRLARDLRDWTLEELSDRSGVEVGTIHALEARDSQRSKYATDLARAFGVSVEDLFEGRLVASDKARQVAPEALLDRALAPSNEFGVEMTGAPAYEAVSVPVMDARGSMGLGLPRPDHETVVDNLRLTKEWVRNNLPSISGPQNLAVLSAHGDSMAPTFSDGDILMVDRGVDHISLDAVYVLALNDELYIKRIQRRITDGAVLILSDNPLFETVEVSNGERDGLQVLGRVVWAWNGRKL